MTTVATTKNPFAGFDPALVKRAQQQARDFESTFIHTMLETMSRGTAESGFSGGAGADTWRSMLNEEMARGVSANGGFGLSEAITRELLGLQETTPSKRRA